MSILNRVASPVQKLKARIARIEQRLKGLIDSNSIDSPTFVVDEANHRVGIGTASPAEKIELVLSANNKIRITEASVAYSQTFSDFDGAGPVIALSRESDGDYLHSISTYNTALDAKSNLGIAARNDIVFQSGGGTETMRLSGGNVGIGKVPDSTVLLDIYSTASRNIVVDTVNPYFTWKDGGTTIGKFGKGSTIMTGGSTTGMGFRSEDLLTFSAGGQPTQMLIDNNGNVGIGTTGPVSKLDVIGNAAIGWASATAVSTNGLSVNGSVGIGIVTPATKLHVNGSGVISQTIESTSSYCLTNYNAGAAGDVTWQVGSGWDNAGDFFIAEDTQASPQLTIKKTTGRVGIGNSSPESILEINGAMTMPEMNNPSAPTANKAVLFVRDNGSGKTQLCVQWTDSTIVALATQG